MVDASTKHFPPNPRYPCVDTEPHGYKTEQSQHSDHHHLQPGLHHAAKPFEYDEPRNVAKTTSARSTCTLKVMPLLYKNCNAEGLAVLISSMLMELIRFNDLLPFKNRHLTHFHARTPPAISVHDYLQTLTMHAALSPSILLSMVYYIDRLCASYPAFTISSLTVHRLLITTATVASKWLTDSCGTTKMYARVGGVPMRELGLLEMEFLWRVEWKIVPKPKVLGVYYLSLVQRSEGYEMERPSPQTQTDKTANMAQEEEKPNQDSSG